MTKKQYRIIFGILLFFGAITAILYSNTLHSPFLFDDLEYIELDPAIRLTELSWDGLKTAAFESRPKHRPIVNISFAINYYFHQYNVTGYHIANIAIHVFCAFFLFLFIRVMLERTQAGQTALPKQTTPSMIAFLAALLWLTYPMHTGAVTYIVQRMTSLAVMFYILSMWLYVAGRISWQQQERPFKTWAFYAGCILSGLLALATKENAATLPVIILLFEWFFFQDLRIRMKKNHILLISGAVLLLTGASLLYLGADPFHRVLSAYSRRDFTLPQRVMTEWRVIVYYISLLIWPSSSRLNLDYDYPLSYSPTDPMTTLVSFTALIALFVMTIYSARRYRLISFCILWFLANLAIESSVIGIEIIFEHRTYLPFMMLCLMIVLLMFQAGKTKLVTAVFSIIILTFSVWTFQRNMVWQSATAFWEDCLRKSPSDYRAASNLGIAYGNAGMPDKAVFEYRKSIQLAEMRGMGKSYYGARNNLAEELIRQNRFEEALQVLEPFLKKPVHAGIHINAGAALTRMGRIDEAVVQYRTAITIDPGSAEAHNNLGVLLIHKGEYAAAISHFQTALRLRPGYSSAAANLQRLSGLMRKMEN